MADKKRMGRPPVYSTDDLTTVKVPRVLADQVKRIIRKLDQGESILDEVPEVDSTKSQDI